MSFPELALAPFYLMMVGSSDLSHKEIIPIYTSIEDCNSQAVEITKFLQKGVHIDGSSIKDDHSDYDALNRYETGNSGDTYNKPPFAFCISTGWKEK